MPLDLHAFSAMVKTDMLWSLKPTPSDVAEVIPTKWRQVGIQLKLSTNTLDRIQDENCKYSNSHERYFRQVFKEWRKQYPESYSWNTLIDVLKKDAVGEDALADAVRNKYIRTPIIASTLEDGECSVLFTAC